MQCRQYLKLMFSIYHWIVCCEKMYEWYGECSDVEHTLCHDLNFCLLEAEVGSLVWAMFLPLYIYKWSCKQCVVLTCMKILCNCKNGHILGQDSQL